jgi:DNA polymerase III epsilon subunit-like protein
MDKKGVYAYKGGVLFGKYDSRRDCADAIGVKKNTLIKAMISGHICNGFQLVDEPIENKKPQILLLDIETLPNSAWTWGMWQQNVSDEQIIRSGCLLSFSCKWLFEPKVFSSILKPQEAIDHDDSRLTKLAWEWLSNADIIIAHNGKAFDTQYLNARFIVHNLPPPAPYKIIDTLNIKKVTKFQKNSLKYLCNELGLRPKLGNDGFVLWAKCERGDKKALREMLEYNEGDVLALEDLYVRLRSWLPNHPNLSLYVEGKDARCGRCNSVNTEFVGEYPTNVNLFKSYRCLDCGSIMRVRQSSTPRIKKPNLLINTSVQ